MYAVIASGGKQYRVAQGDVIRVEKLDAEAGAPIDFDKVLLIADGDSVNVGDPYIQGGNVSGRVRSHNRSRKINIIKFKRRKHHLKQMGHRQHYTEVEIVGIDS